MLTWQTSLCGQLGKGLLAERRIVTYKATQEFDVIVERFSKRHLSGYDVEDARVPIVIPPSLHFEGKAPRRIEYVPLATYVLANSIELAVFSRILWKLPHSRESFS